MPELPEVETIRMQLEKFLRGKKITGVEIKTAKSFPDDKKKVLGARMTGTRRFGKVLVIDLDNGYSLLVHLKLTGQLLVGGTIGPHTRVIINLEKGQRLIFNDLRIFGWIKIADSGQVTADRLISKLGLEPLKDLTLTKFKDLLAKTARPIKIVLMDQEKISGVGNIYANDALWLAGIDPRTPARQLDGSTAGQLYEAVLEVLKKGIRYGGASDQHYIKPDGTKGKYQDHFLVYGREKMPCLRCKAKIEKFFLGGRGTYVCEVCQK